MKYLFFFDIETSLDEKIVFETAYESFYEIGKSFKKQKDPYLFISQILTASGYGLVDKIDANNKIIFNFFGYPCFSDKFKKSNFPIIKGIVKGFIDGNTNTSNPIQ